METTTPAPRRNLPRDVFLHLFAMVALYWSAISFITLCWQYINYFFPDLLAVRYGGGQAYVWPLRFAVSSLVIIFPLFILSSWYLNKIYKKEAQVRESKVRKWLIYLTLFAAALIIIGDLVTLINNFLGGEITVRFVLKALSVLAVTVAIFWYYLDDVRKSEPSKLGRYFAWASSAIVIAGVIGALFIVGSPMSARLVQFDNQKVGDLQGIQYQITSYWQRKGQLPNTLTDLNDPISGYIVPNDPQTNEPYEYSVKNAENLTFELCAKFNVAATAQEYPTKPNQYPVSGSEFSQTWDHGEGRTCFERTIDRQLYPPLNKEDF